MHTLLWGSPRYPKLLREIRNPPKVLYARGNLDLLETTCFAIVGTRASTPYGEHHATRFTQGLVSYEFTIVSGLAFGIDAVVHEATLAAHGKTIAVLGNGIDHITPRAHESLAQDILKKGGLLLSEYKPGEVAHRHHFPARNRILSGLCIGTLLIEAPEKSGALITAHRAFEQNRDVFVVPGDLERETFRGNHNLIANDMARLVRTPEDVINQLSHQPELVLRPMIQRARAPSLVTSAQKKVWALVSRQPVDADEIFQQTRLSISEVLVALAYLELKGHIQAAGQGKFMRAVGSNPFESRVPLPPGSSIRRAL